LIDQADLSKRSIVKQIYGLWKEALPDAGRTFRKTAEGLEINPQAMVQDLFVTWHQLSKMEKLAALLTIAYKVEAEDE
jgi:hypothetical protein